MEAKLDEIIFQMRELNKKIDKTEERMLKQMAELIKGNQEEIKELKEENKALKETIFEQQEKMKELDNKQRKNNIVILGLEEKEKNILELEGTVKNVIETKLNIDIANNDINFVARIGPSGGRERPVLVGCTTWRLKKEILNRKRMLRSSAIVIKEDLPKEVREDRKELGKVMLQLQEDGKRVSLRGNKIYYEGKYYGKNELDTLEKDINTTKRYVHNKRQRSEEDQEVGQGKKK